MPPLATVQFDEGASEPLRFALVGVGANIASQHLHALAATQGAVLVAACDVNPAAAERIAGSPGVTFYTDTASMLEDAAPDVVVVMTPHPFHTTVALAALGAGAHVLVEKPIAVTTSEADAMIAAADRSGRTLAVSFQHRFSPLTERLKAWVESGELGEVTRVAVSEPWLRTAAYFHTARWRATWRGEGGGVLLNQAPHALDLLTYLFGSPARVSGLTRTQRHDIECEDAAHALLEWEDGAIGYFGSSTTEPETGRRVEIVGDLAQVRVEGDTVWRTDVTPGLREHAASDPAPFGRPRLEPWEPLSLTAGSTHAPVYADLVAAINEGRAPRCDGRAGRASLELANAIALSSWLARPVTLPLDREAYDAALEERRTGMP